MLARLRDRLNAALTADRAYRAESAAPTEVDSDPVDHLRRAVAASRTDKRAAPRIYSELRLLLNQLEAGRISEELPTPLIRRAPDLSWRSRLRRMWHAARRWDSSTR